jgi:hypothetical protein
MRRLRDRACQESGWAVLTAILLMTIMLGSSLAVVAYVDNETTQSKTARHRETAFNLGEAALNAQVFALARDWPGAGKAADAYAPCLPATGGSHCSSNARLMALFPTSDAAVGANWQTQVRDNTVPGAPNFYDDAQAQAAPGYDANGDNLLWVRSQATTRGKTRTMIALVRAETQYEDIPHAAVVTGRLDVDNNGNQTKVDTGTSSVGVAVRCHHHLGEPSACLGYDIDDPPYKGSEATYQSQLADAIEPKAVTEDYQDVPSMTPEALERVTATARANGTYHTACPASLNGTVVIDVHTSCSYSGGTSNSKQAPGMVVLLDSDSSLSANGSFRFYGAIYHANLPAPGSNGTLLYFSGNADIHSGTVIDGANGRLGIQGSAGIDFDDTGFGSVRSIGSAGVVQNTWRELMSR